MKLRPQGRFIVLDGVEGAGKTTLLPHVEAFLRERGFPVVTTREPGGSELAERIRKLLLEKRGEALRDEAELLLMCAARVQHIANCLAPALASGQWVVCDRFRDATYAYQGAGRGLGDERIEQIERAAGIDLCPDLTLLLDVDPRVGLERVAARGPGDRIEEAEGALQFLKRARQGYLRRAGMCPQRYLRIDANQPPDQMIADALAALRAHPVMGGKEKLP